MSPTPGLVIKMNCVTEYERLKALILALPQIPALTREEKESWAIANATIDKVTK